LSFYHKDTPWIPKETMKYPTGTQWPMTLKEGIFGVLYHVCSTYHKEALEYLEMSV
jgi:hypothetical protein